MADRSYQFPNQTLPGLNYEANLDDLREFILLMESLGINVSGTRIARYESYYESLVEGNDDVKRIFQGISGKKFNNPQDLEVYVLREVHELMWILKGLKKHLPKGVEEKLNQVVGAETLRPWIKTHHLETLSLNCELQVISVRRVIQWICLISLM